MHCWKSTDRTTLSMILLWAAVVAYGKQRNSWDIRGQDECNQTVKRGIHWPADKSSLSSHPYVNSTSCSQLCCRTEGCGHWVWTSEEPVAAGECPVGVPCCWLKPGIPLYPEVADSGMIAGWLDRANFTANHSARIDIKSSWPDGKSRQLDARFVSVGCETWEWLFDPNALQTSALKNVMKALAPGILRVGGTSADFTNYSEVTMGHQVTYSGDNFPATYGLNASTFDSLIKACTEAGLDLIFDLNELYGRRAGAGPPDFSNVEAFLRHVRDSGAVHPGGPLIGVELGNELTRINSTGLLNVSTQVADYNLLHQIMNHTFAGVDAPLLYGPSTCSSYEMDVFVEKTVRHLSAFTFHDYPYGGKNLVEALVDPFALKEISKQIDEWVQVWQKGSNGEIPLFMTETSSTAATGNNNGQDGFVNGFWYMTSLGEVASRGFMPFHTRWKLWSPRVAYRPMALNQTFGFLDKSFTRAAPDLWIALLHKKLIGAGTALPTTSNDTSVSAWAYMSADEELVMMVVNPLNESKEIEMTLDDDRISGEWEEFIFTAATPNDLASHYTKLNGAKLPVLLGPDGKIPILEGRLVEAGKNALDMPPHSYGFVRFKKQR